MCKMNVHCTTTLDEFKREIWPKSFVAKPKKGDLVRSDSGKLLTIHTITHCESKSELHAPYLDKGEPYLEIYIHH